MSQNNPPASAHAFKKGNVFHTCVTNASRSGYIPRLCMPAIGSHPVSHMRVLCLNNIIYNIFLNK